MDEPAANIRATLEELERLQLQIQRYRSQRKAAAEEFERFVQSFEAAREAVATPVQEPIVAPRKALASAAESPAPPAPLDQAAAVVAPPVETPASLATLPKGQSSRKTRPMIVGAATVVVAALLVTWWLMSRPRDAEMPATRARDPVASQAPPPAVAPRPAPLDPMESALTTTRAVWVRVTVDGQRILERELPANARVPLKVEKSVVIRAGDAGAIRLVLRGKDQGALGATGEVVTRTFSVAR